MYYVRYYNVSDIIKKVRCNIFYLVISHPPKKNKINILITEINKKNKIKYFVFQIK